MRSLFKKDITRKRKLITFGKTAMITMKTSRRNILVIIVLIHCFGDASSDENNVQLYPSPNAEVEEGSTLHLQCSCTSTPNFLNWYLNDDTYGLVIEADKCSYQIKPIIYEVERYSVFCHTTTFNLSIANISKSKDDGAVWKCDNTIIGMNPPKKTSTRIIVKDRKDGKSSELGFGAGPSNGFAVIVITLGSFVGFIVCVVVLYLIYRKRRTTRMNGQAVEVHIGGHLSDSYKPEQEKQLLEQTM